MIKWIIAAVIVVLVAMYLYGRHRVLSHPLGKTALELGLTLDEVIEYDSILKEFSEAYARDPKKARLRTPKNFNRYNKYVEYVSRKDYEERMSKIRNMK